jgi:hypothetical protein
MDTSRTPDLALSPSEKLTLKHVAEGELLAARGRSEDTGAAGLIPDRTATPPNRKVGRSGA